MSDPLYAFPTVCGQTLRALRAIPSRTAFSWPGGSITYQGTTELIGRMQKVFMQLGLQPGARVAFPHRQRAIPGPPASPRNCRDFRSPGLQSLGSARRSALSIEDSEAEMLVIRRRYVSAIAVATSRRAPAALSMCSPSAPPSSPAVDLLAAAD